ncbi:hypothetical protein DSECCO2_614010 [anaerobic digester metagenome]
MLSGPSRFHCRIQGQNIGLEGNIINDLDNLGDIFRRLVDLHHRLLHFRHLMVTFVGISHHIGGQFSGFIGIDGVILGLIGNLRNRNRQFLNRAGLLGGSLGQRLTAVGYLVGPGINLLCGMINVTQQRVQGSNNGIEGIRNYTKITAEITDIVQVKIAFANRLGNRRYFPNNFLESRPH